MKLGRIILLACLLVAGAGLASLPVSQAADDLPVYTDARATGWQDWEYNDVTRNYANASPVHSGSASIAVTCNGGWSALQLGYHGANLDVSAYDTLRFWINGGPQGGQHIELQIDNSTIQSITLQANTWTRVDVSLLSLGSPRTVYSIVWLNNTDSGQPTFYLDDIAFVDSGATPTPTPPPGSGPALSVNAGANRHAISPYIYGMSYADEALAADLRLPVRRWGGNSTTRYNWQIDVHNTGSDWYFENVPEDNANPGLLPNGSAADRFVEQDRRTGTKTLLTVPLIGWTPKGPRKEHPFDCGFKVSKYGAQNDTDYWDSDCGNGERGSNPVTLITGNDPLDTSTAITTTFVVSWINHLTARYGTAANGGVQFYDLDNEPMLWNSTHRDVHPAPTTYDELRSRTYAYASAIKAADPSAQTLGPVVWGWCAYFYSAADDCRADGVDHQAHGNMDFVEWYLQQMKAYEDAHGVRILDYVDVHIYPQADGIYSENQGDASMQANRLRSTRQLWDSTYFDNSWIGLDVGASIYLIPRMKQWATARYPGTKLAISEYNWGALGYMNGALAQADLLGIFGREGLDLATLWGPPDIDDPGAYAFRMYRNYDGQDSGFGETSVQAASTDQEQLAVYAAQRGADQALTLMIINKTGQALTSTLTLTNFQPAAAAQVYRYSSANLAAIVRVSDQAVAAGGFTATFPANSISLIVIPSGGPDVPLLHPVYLPVVLRGD